MLLTNLKIQEKALSAIVSPENTDAGIECMPRCLFEVSGSRHLSGLYKSHIVICWRAQKTGHPNKHLKLFFIKNQNTSRHWWLTPVILAT
jgi:hypothetical protein